MKNVILSILILATIPLRAQTFRDSIAAYQNQYIKELLEDKRSPIKPADVKFMHFFPADRSYCVWGEVTITAGSKPFLINTHSGKQKPFKEYGTITFTIHDTTRTLHMYQSVDILSGRPTTDDLFIPFTDLTNYEATFAGGRYIDLSVKDITNNRLLVDFNKCYNPYCAFAEGYSCPIPPDENSLHMQIRAGEMMFSKHIGY